MQRPPFRLRDPAVAALWAVAAGLLALAALDYLAYDFVLVDLVAHEARRHATLGRSSLFHIGIPARAAVALTGVAVVALLGACLLARIRRLSRRLWAVAACAAALLVATLLLTTWQARIDHPGFERDPTTGALWHTARGRARWPEPIAHVSAFELLTATLPVLALVALLAVRRPHTWRVALATAVPATLAAGALASLWRTFGEFTATGHESWVTDLQTARAVLLGSVLALVVLNLLVRTRPAHAPLSVTPPALLLALGVAAVALTAPHRAAIDGLYPLPAAAAHPLDFDSWGPRRPWDLDLPPATTCEPGPADLTPLIVRIDAGRLVLHHRWYRPVPLADGPAHLHDSYRRPSYVHLALMFDRRVPMAALLPLLTDLPRDIGFTLTVAGAATHTLPSADGPVIAWSLCARGELQLAALRASHLPADATWGDIVDDPTLVQP